MKSKRRVRILTAVCAGIVVLVIFPLLIGYTHLTDHQLKSYITQTLDEISERNVCSINDKINSDLILLQEISERFSISDDNFSILMKDLDTTSGQHGFKRMGLVDDKGKTYCSDNAVIDVTNEEHIRKAFSGQTVVSDVFLDFADGKRIFVYTAPVYYYDTNTIKGVLYATCDTTAFREHLSETAFDGHGYSYIVKSDGTVVTDSAHPSSYKNMTNIFESMLASGNNEKAVAQMKTDMSDGGQGNIIFINSGIKKYMNYEALGINDWYMLSVTPVDVMDANRNNIIMLTIVLVALILIITVAIFIVLIKSEKARSREYEKVLYIDPLTGGISFAKFCIDAPQLISKSDKNAACVMADFDNFKLIQNLYGNTESDKIIVHAYEVFNKIIGDNGLLTRRVEDKYYALVFFSDENELKELLQKFITKFRNSWNSHDADYNLNLTIGVCIVNGAEDIETIANNATIAHDGIDKDGERIAFYDDVQRDRMKNNKILEDKMEHAHKNHEFVPFVQPKYDPNTGKICGAEALVRWKSADGSITYPDRFIPLAERNGFIRVLDRDMFEAVCKLQRQIIDSGLPVVPISVNVSRQLMYEQRFADDYVEILKRYRLSPDTIELEITESVLFDDFDGFRKIVNTLRENGFKILMDDFGTGYSSLMMLSSVPIDNLKLDKSFIDRFDDEKGKKIINCVIELAKSLKLPITAEGVETSEQCDFLKEKGCDIIQGYYYSKPVPQDIFLDMLKQSDAAKE